MVARCFTITETARPMRLDASQRRFRVRRNWDDVDVDLDGDCAYCLDCPAVRWEEAQNCRHVKALYRHLKKAGAV